MTARWPRGFYAVLDREDEQLARNLLAGASVLQVRIKPGTTADIMRVATLARRLCTNAGVPLVINDRVDIALAVGADGVHLGQTDMPPEDARRIATTRNARLAIGLSTHDLAQVARAVAIRPDYIAYGPVFATSTKQNPDPVQGISALRAAVSAAGGIPVVAIGGITPHNAPDVLATGVSAVCAISAVNAAPDVGAAVQELRRSYARLHGE